VCGVLSTKVEISMTRTRERRLVAGEATNILESYTYIMLNIGLEVIQYHNIVMSPTARAKVLRSPTSS